MTVSRHESPTGSISQVTREVPARSASSLHSVCMVWTNRWGGSTTRFSPSTSGRSEAGCTSAYGDPGVQADSTPAPKWYLARIIGSVIAAHSRSGVVRM